jgi:hypothetical protein
MTEISVRVGSRAEAEWLWSRFVGARIESEPIRVVIDPSPADRLSRVVETVQRGLRARTLTDAELVHDGRTYALDTAPAI